MYRRGWISYFYGKLWNMGKYDQVINVASGSLVWNCKFNLFSPALNIRTCQKLDFLVIERWTRRMWKVLTFISIYSPILFTEYTTCKTIKHCTMFQVSFLDYIGWYDEKPPKCAKRSSKFLCTCRTMCIPTVCLFVYSRLSNFAAIRRLSPLLATGLQI
jgi:hypothetical protein